MIFVGGIIPAKRKAMSHDTTPSVPTDLRMETTTTTTTTTYSNTERDGSEMVLTWLWLVLAMIFIVFVCKFCAWCARQNREFGSTRNRRLSAVAIIDAAAPDPVTCPRCERSEYLRTIPDEPPPYASLTPVYHEDPPPPYSSLSLQPLPTQEVGPHVSNRNEDSSRIVHI